MLQSIICVLFPLYRGLQQEAQKTTVKEDTVVFCCHFGESHIICLSELDQKLY